MAGQHGETRTFCNSRTSQRGSSVQRNLSVNLISGGRYYRAWDDIADADLPAFARKFAVPEGDGKQAPAPAAPAVAHSKAKVVLTGGKKRKASSAIGLPASKPHGSTC